MDLDLAHQDHQQQKEEEEEEEQQQRFHVLAVDDSHTDRKLLQRLLTISSYQVTCVDSGDEALKYLDSLDHIHSHSHSTHNIIHDHQHQTSSTPSSSQSLSSSNNQQVSKVNLIMTDYSMPGMNGYDLLKRIKESSWKDIPVVVMSSENVPSRINMCLEGGAEEFLLKPVKEADLRKLRSHLLMMNNNNNNNTVSHCQHNISCRNMSTKKGEDMTMMMVKEMDNTSMANKRKATLTTTSSDRSRPRVVQELPVS